MAKPHVKMYTLSTCHHCKAAKKFLANCGVEFEFTDVDLLAGAEREAVLAEVRRLNPECSFPTILIDNQVVVGDNEEKIRKALGVVMDLVRFREVVRQAQEPQGYFFNADEALVTELLEALVVNKDRYGYMSCPCRLASGVREKDRDIMCPCVYRPPDVMEYGSCYCGLYVSAAFNAGEVPKRQVPERRPPGNVV